MTQSGSGEPSGSQLAPQVPPVVDWSWELSRHDRWLRTVVLARLGGRDGVDEVMQEVALAAVAQRSPLTDPNKVAPWLYRLAVTQSLLYRRKLGRRRRLTTRYALERRPEEADTRGLDPLHWLLHDERRQMVRTCLRRLPHRDCEMLLLKYSEGWSYQQLARQLGMSESAVEARLHRARAKLRNEIMQCESVEVGFS